MIHVPQFQHNKNPISLHENCHKFLSLNNNVHFLAPIKKCAVTRTFTLFTGLYLETRFYAYITLQQNHQSFQSPAYSLFDGYYVDVDSTNYDIL